jgi:hypothetical protein
MNAPSGEGNIPPNPREYHISRSGLPSHNPNITGGVHILTKTTHTRRNASLDKDPHTTPSQEERVTTNPTPVDS